jgi:hypothetical protein
MIRLFIAVLIGGILATGTAFAVSGLVSSSGGPPPNSQCCNYGRR